jgi:hypothetical protein
VTFTRGEAVVIPASLAGASIRPQWELELIRAWVPEGKVEVPKTAAVNPGEAVVST